MERFILIERDGVINVQRESPIKSLNEFALRPFVQEAFFELRRNQIHTVILTNQPGIEEGVLDYQTLAEIHAQLQVALEESGGKVHDILICPDADPKSGCRYPNPDLLQTAAAKHKFNLSETFFVCPRMECLQAGWVAGCKPVSFVPEIHIKLYRRFEHPNSSPISSHATSLAPFIKY